MTRLKKVKRNIPGEDYYLIEDSKIDNKGEVEGEM